jgi:hypothetical protein
MIFKLTYPNKDTAVNDLLAKGVYINTDEGLAYGDGVQAVVEIGLIVLDIVDDEPIYADGYHYDVMAENVYDFGANLVEPKNPKHAFAGHAITEEFPYNPMFEMRHKDANRFDVLRVRLRNLHCANI